MAAHNVAADARVKHHVVKCNLCDTTISDQTEAFKTNVPVRLLCVVNAVLTTGARPLSFIQVVLARVLHKGRVRRVREAPGVPCGEWWR